MFVMERYSDYGWHQTNITDTWDEFIDAIVGFKARTRPEMGRMVQIVKANDPFGILCSVAFRPFTPTICADVLGIAYLGLSLPKSILGRKKGRL